MYVLKCETVTARCHAACSPNPDTDEVVTTDDISTFRTVVGEGDKQCDDSLAQLVSQHTPRPQPAQAQRDVVARKAVLGRWTLHHQAVDDSQQPV